MLRNSLYRYGDENGRVPAHMHFGKEVYDNMLQNKELVALINADTDEQMTYKEIAQMTANVAVSLYRLGVRKGDVVSICSEKRLEMLPCVLGIMCSGGVFAPTDPTYGAHPFLHRLNIVRPKVMFCSLAAYKAHRAAFESCGGIEHYILFGNEKQHDFALFDEFMSEFVDIDSFEPVPVNGWDDTAFIVFSSGTTGLPKGIPLTHLGFSLNSQDIVPYSYRGVQVFSTGQWYSNYRLKYALSYLKVGATIIYSTSPDQENVLRAIQKYIKAMQLNTSMLLELTKSLILDNYDLSSLEWMVCGGAPVRADTVAAIKKRLPNLTSILQIYGMTEAGAMCNAFRGSKPGSAGLPCLGFVIKVVDLETRQPLGPNQPGEICVKGPSVMKVYMNNLNPDCKDSEGFLMTGDVGYYDDDGYFFIVNRIKEMIKFNDVAISPAEFEDILMQHSAVREAGVVGSPHPQHEEVPVAFVVLQPGMTATEEELVTHLNTRVTYTMRLAGGVRFVERLPRGATGDKLDRQELKRMLQNTT